MSNLEFDLRDFNKRTNRALRNVNPKVAIPALEKVSKKIIQEAKVMTPVDTGKLRNSLNAEVKLLGTPTAIMGSDVEYALIVHEDLSAIHILP